MPAQPRTVLVGVAVASGSTSTVEPMRLAFGTAIGAWVGELAQPWQVQSIEPSTLGPRLAPQTVRSAGAAHGLVFEILDFTVTTTPDGIPLARARVRARIAEPDRVQFDRVIATDTIVGNKGMKPEVLAARCAREVLLILRPHLRRAEPAW
jgi:hypothetical protein